MTDFTGEFQIEYTSDGSLDASAAAAKERLESVTAEPTVSPVVNTDAVVGDLEDDLGDLTVSANADVAGAAGGTGVGAGSNTFTAAATSTSSTGDSELVDLAEREVELLDEIADELEQSGGGSLSGSGGGGGGAGGGFLGAGRLAAGGVGLTGLATGGLAAALGGGGVALSAMLGDRLTEDGGEFDLTNLLYGAVDDGDSFLNQPDSGAENGYEEGESVLGFIADRFSERGGAGDEISELNSTLQNIDLGSQLETAASNATDELSSVSLNIDDSRLPDFFTGGGSTVSVDVDSPDQLDTLASVADGIDVTAEESVKPILDGVEVGVADELEPFTGDNGVVVEATDTVASISDGVEVEAEETLSNIADGVAVGATDQLESLVSAIPGVGGGNGDGGGNEGGKTNSTDPPIDTSPRPAKRAVDTYDSKKNTVTADPTVETTVEIDARGDVEQSVKRAVEEQLKSEVPSDRELRRKIEQVVTDMFDDLR